MAGRIRCIGAPVSCFGGPVTEGREEFAENKGAVGAVGADCFAQIIYNIGA